MKYITILVLSGLFLVSCGDREDPEVRFITPAQNTEVDAGGQVSIQTEVTDNEQISSITVGGDVQEFAIPAADFDDLMKHNFIFNLNIGADTPVDSEITVTVNATDAEGNEGSEDLVLVVK